MHMKSSNKKQDSVKYASSCKLTRKRMSSEKCKPGVRLKRRINTFKETLKNSTKKLFREKA
jgi:hypothetical protein